MKLVTVEAFNVPIQAEIARNALESAGIRAVLQDAEVVGNLGVYSNAVGGVKIQVRDFDVPRALEVLRELPKEYSVDEDELTRQALEALPDDSIDLPLQPEPAAQKAVDIISDPIRSPMPFHERDSYAFRFFRLTVFNFFVSVLTPYAIYLLLNALFGSGPISRNGWWRILVGTLLLGIQPGLWFFALIGRANFLE